MGYKQDRMKIQVLISCAAAAFSKQQAHYEHNPVNDQPHCICNAQRVRNYCISTFSSISSLANINDSEM